MENEIVLFTDGNVQLEVPVSQDGESVWLSSNQMADLFGKDQTTIRKHINNIFKSIEVNKNNNTQKMRVDGVKQPVDKFLSVFPESVLTEGCSIDIDEYSCGAGTKIIKMTPQNAE